MEVRAVAKWLHHSPRKVRLVVDAIRGLSVVEALAVLRTMPQAAAVPVFKAVKSASANAENNFGLDLDDLYVKRIWADDGPRLKRWNPVSRGRAHPILKRLSHITVVVDDELATPTVRRRS